MNGNGPGQSQGKLDEDAQLFLDNLLLLFIEGIANVLPDFANHIVLVAVLVHHADKPFFLVDARHHANGAVYPAFLLVVLDKDDLCARLDLQLHRGG